MIPALANYFIAMFKETPLLSAITVLELMNQAKSVANSSYRYIEPMTLVGVFFLVISLISVVVLRWLEERYARMDELMMTDRDPEINGLPTPRRRALDDRPLEKRIGLIILATDHTTEVDFQRMVASDRIGVYVTRIPYANPVTPENLLKMQPSLTDGAGLILPGRAARCGHVFLHLGLRRHRRRRRSRRRSQAAKPGVPVVTPTAAAVRG